MRRGGRPERGAVAMYFVFALAIAASASAIALEGRFRGLIGEIRTDRARLVAHWVAEGAVEHARWALSHDRAYTGGQVRVGGGEALVSIERGADPGVVRIVADALVERGAGGSAARRVAVRVRFVEGKPEIEHWSASR